MTQIRTVLKYLLFSPLFFSLYGATLKPVKEQKSAKPTILVSIAPYRFILKELTGGEINIETLVPRGYDAHSFEVTPKKLTSLEKAKLWIGVGEPFEKKAIESIKEKAKGLKLIDLSKELPLMPLENSSTKDRHIWLSLKLMQEEAHLIAKALIKLFPKNRPLYEGNLIALLKKLSSLDDTLQIILKESKGDTLLIAHPALGYFCKDYGLKQLSIEKEGKPPTPKQLHLLMEKAKNKTTPLAIAIMGHETKGISLLAKSLSLPLYSFDPYEENLEKNLLTLAKAIAKKGKRG